MDADSASLTTAADDSVINAIVSALSGSDRTQLQDESEVLEDIAAAAGDDIRSRQIETAVMAQDNVVPEHFSLMTGSMDTADWTAFDQLAEQSGDIDDALNWSIVVSLTCLVKKYGSLDLSMSVTVLLLQLQRYSQAVCPWGSLLHQTAM